jgi:hypothetical protein
MNSMTKRRALDVLAALAVILLLIAGGATLAFAKPVPKPVTWYVDDDAIGGNDGTSWADAFTGLQDALDAAMPGDAIWVAAGTYLPTRIYDGTANPRKVSFILESGVAVYGGFEGFEKSLRERSPDPWRTVLSGDIGIPGDDADNAFHVVYAEGVTGAVLDGFTVTGGRGYDSGGGMLARDSRLTVAHCVFRDNHAFHRGGGMASIDSALAVTGCVFEANRVGPLDELALVGSNWGAKGGGMYNRGRYDGWESSVIQGCTFRENRVSNSSGGDWPGGGGMCNEDCAPSIDRCTFERNWARGSSAFGGGMLNNMALPTITSSVFTGNWAFFAGGGMATMGRATIVNCTFHGNGWGPALDGSLIPRTLMGGAIYEYRSSGSRIINSLFSRNAANGGWGGAITAGTFSRPGLLQITRCLFHENFAYSTKDSFLISHLQLNGTFPPALDDSLFDLDPWLADPENGDFHLLEGSPAIDAGLTAKEAAFDWIPMPDKDFDGGKRVVDGDGLPGLRADIGADEYVPALPELRNLIQEMADAGEIDGALAAALLAEVDAAQAALDAGDTPGAKGILDALIVTIKTLDDNTVTEAILAKAEAVQGTLD